MIGRRWFWIAILLILLATAALRIHLLQTPLERDEGEYAYAGQLMLHGIPPYLYAANMKLPGTYAAYALLMAIFGQTIAGVHLGLLVVNAIAIVLVALIGRRLLGAVSGIAAGAAYALMSFGFSVLGTQAHATHFVVAAALGGFLLLLRYEDVPRMPALVGSGLLFGLAFLMKQHGIFFGVAGLTWLALSEWRRRGKLPVARCVIFSAAMAAPFALTCLLLWRAGVFGKFWFWTFTYASAYAAESSLAQGLANLWWNLPPIIEENAALWILGAAGLIWLWFTAETRKSAAFLTLLAIFSALAVCPGFYFRSHYFVMVLPAIALMAGAMARGRLSSGLFAAALLVSVFTQRQFLFHMSPNEVSHEMYGPNLFSEAIPVASYIRTHAGSNAKIAVLGSEPEIYFYAQRLSATSLIYTYGMMESQPYAITMQEEMIQEITDASPEFVVIADSPLSWLQRSESFTRIFDWWSVYGPQHYREIGIAGRKENGASEIHWDGGARRDQLRGNSLVVFQRR